MNTRVHEIVDGKKFNSDGEELVECTTCGKLTTMTGTKLCDGCWELERAVEYARRNKIHLTRTSHN